MLTTLKCMTPTDGLIFRAHLYQSGLGLSPPPFFGLLQKPYSMQVTCISHSFIINTWMIYVKTHLYFFLRSYTFMLFFSFNTDLSTYGNLDEQMCFLSAEVLTCHPVSYLRKNNETWANNGQLCDLSALSLEKKLPRKTEACGLAPESEALFLERQIIA